MATKNEQIKKFNTNDTPPIPENKDGTQLNEKQQTIKTEAENTAEKRKLDQIEEEKQKQQEQEERDKQDTLNKIGNKIQEGQEVVISNLSPFVQWLGKQPTPGGVATVFIVLLFFLFAVIPVNANGDTRLKLIWLTLTGKTSMHYDPGVLGGGGNFGDNTTLPNNAQSPITMPSQPSKSIIPDIPISQNGFTPIDTNNLLSLFSFGE
jgi:hypothetical protein